MVTIMPIPEVVTVTEDSCNVCKLILSSVRSQESGAVQRRRPRRLQLDDGRVGPAADGAGGVQLRRGDAAVPGRRRGAGTAGRRHALLRLLGTMDFMLHSELLNF